MPIIEQQDPLSAAVSAVGGYLGQQAQNKYLSEQLGQQQDELELEKQRQSTANALAQAQLQKQQTENEQTTANQQFESGLKLPKNWSKLGPDQKTSYLEQRYNNALAAHDYDAANATLAQMNSLGLGTERLATAGLKQAQTLNTRNLFAHQDQELKARLGNQYSIAVAKELGAQQRFAQSLGLRSQIANMNHDDRYTLAMLTAYNRASANSDSDAFRMALAQYNAGTAAWRMGASAATSGLTGTDASTALGQYEQSNPQPVFNVSIPSQQPQVILIKDPRDPNQKIPVVVQGNSSTNGSQQPQQKTASSVLSPVQKPAPPNGKHVSLAKAMAMPQNRGKSQAQVRADIQAHGYVVDP